MCVCERGKNLYPSLYKIERDINILRESERREIKRDSEIEREGVHINTYMNAYIFLYVL